MKKNHGERTGVIAVNDNNIYSYTVKLHVFSEALNVK